MVKGRNKVIPEKGHPIKNLIRRKNRVHERHEKHEQKQNSFVPFVFFVDDSFGGFIIGNHLGRGVSEPNSGNAPVLLWARRITRKNGVNVRTGLLRAIDHPVPHAPTVVGNLVGGLNAKNAVKTHHEPLSTVKDMERCGSTQAKRKPILLLRLSGLLLLR